ncbi:MAG TPA: 3-keto-5-aminohexanoate cleavage protein [Solirubrobacterales bacterium]|nr:3-keto-5-aminohexanoate cleavage protein [Solirubrobacterales bacterium]
MVVNAALTGAVPGKVDNPLVPIGPEEIAADAIACAEAGATVVHLHVRDEEGAPVHRRDLYERAITPIREEAPELAICVTTSSRVDPDPAARMVGLELEEALRPDLASLTLGSFNFPNSVSANPPKTIVGLLERMAELGVRPEFEVFEPGMVNTLHALAERGLVPDRPVVNILLGSMGSSPAFVGDLARIVEKLPPQAEWAAAGVGVFQRSMTIAAAIMDGNVRTGLEDNPRGDGDGRWGNVDAVLLAAEAAKLAGRPLASPAEARRRFGLQPARVASDAPRALDLHAN